MTKLFISGSDFVIRDAARLTKLGAGLASTHGVIVAGEGGGGEADVLPSRQSKN